MNARYGHLFWILSYAFLGSIVQKNILTMPKLTKMLDKILMKSSSVLKDTVKGINRLNNLYNYCSEKQLNIVSIGHIHELKFDNGSIEVDIDQLLMNMVNIFYFIQYMIMYLIKIKLIVILNVH